MKSVAILNFLSLTLAETASIELSLLKCDQNCLEPLPLDPAEVSLIAQPNESIEKALFDFRDVQLYAELYFGPNQEPHTVIFDTGSSWLWVQTPECFDCPSQNDYQPLVAPVDANNRTVTYGSGSIVGHLY